MPPLSLRRRLTSRTPSVSARMRERQVVLRRRTPCVNQRIVEADAEDRGSSGGGTCKDVVPELTGLRGAAGRVVLRVKIQHHPLAVSVLIQSVWTLPVLVRASSKSRRRIAFCQAHRQAPWGHSSVESSSSRHDSPNPSLESSSLWSSFHLRPSQPKWPMRISQLETV